MSESGIGTKYRNFIPDRHEAASVFIGNLPHEAAEAASEVAEAFYSKAKKPVKTAILIPVAAHQDGKLIIPALAQYAKQEPPDPFTIFMYLNSPDGADTSKVKAAIANVRKAQGLFPQLDIRYSTQTYLDPKIGRIRRDLWNGALMLMHHEGQLPNDVLGFNHDIDTVKIGPNYIAYVQEYYKERDATRRKASGNDVADRVVQRGLATRVTHAVLPTHPNVGKVTTWIDYSYYQAALGYEAGLVLPFSHYVDCGGFNSEDSTHETAVFYSEDSPIYLPKAGLYTSPRRYIDRLANGKNTDEVWTDESFGSSDECRDRLPRDITIEQASQLLEKRLMDDIRYHWSISSRMRFSDESFSLLLLSDSISEKEFIKHATMGAREQKRLAEKFMRRVVGIGRLADIIASYDETK